MTETANTAQPSSEAPAPAATVQRVTINDLLEVLGAGLRDFRAAPFYGLAVGGIYMLGGWVLFLLLMRFDLPFLVYPLAAGFALIAPFIATAFYAISHRLERKEILSWGGIAASVRGAMGRDLGWMALVTCFAMIIWMDIAAVLFFGLLGLKSMGVQELLREIFTTPMGLLLLVLGNSIGALIAFGVFSFSVISFPMLFDRNIDFVTAMITSVKLVMLNPMTMAIWCFVIAVLIGISLLSGLLGLLVVLPVLGHTSWHLYRRAVSNA